MHTFAYADPGNPCRKWLSKHKGHWDAWLKALGAITGTLQLEWNTEYFPPQATTRRASLSTHASFSRKTHGFYHHQHADGKCLHVLACLWDKLCSGLCGSWRMSDDVVLTLDRGCGNLGNLCAQAGVAGLSDVWGHHMVGGSGPQRWN